MKHFPGHQQALLKNNIVTAVLVFDKHNVFNMRKTFNRFDYDKVINLCRVQKDAVIGSVWNGKVFNAKPSESWILGEDLDWHPPIARPDTDELFVWSEESNSWIEIDPECGCPK